MSSSQSVVRKDSLSRKMRQKVIKKRNISADEFMAASIGDLEWLDQSLRGSEDNSNFDRNGLAPIHLAALHGRLNCLQLLIEKYQVYVNLPSATGWTPLHLCINKESGSRAFKCMKYLLRQGAEVDCINTDCVTPLHQAASEGLLDCLKTLIEKNADLNMTDVRGHLPLDLARLWAHKSCVKLIRSEMWRRNIQDRTDEMKQLNIVKKHYADLQKEAIHLLKNEQDFYGEVRFGNWLADKGLSEKLKHMTILQRERCSEPSIQGLSKRLITSGGIDDCSQRMEKSLEHQMRKTSNLLKKQTAAPIEERNRVAEKQNKQVSKSKPEKQNMVKPVTKKVAEEKVVKRVVKVVEEKPFISTSQLEMLDGSKTTTPYSEAVVPSVKPAWNFSTNLDSDPVTNIKCKENVALSIYPDENDILFSVKADLYTKLESTASPKIKVTLPGGRIQSAGIRMPQLPPALIAQALSGMPGDRIRIPQDFKAVHVYDIQKKKQPSARPKDEVGMHLSTLGDPRFLWKSVSSTTYLSETSLSTLSSNSCSNLPAIPTYGYSRTLDTLHRMNPPKSFLA